HLDCVKNYLSLRRVPYSLQERVINWFDYLWYTNKITDEENVLNDLPDKLRAEIAIQMHLDTLKRVEIFQNTEEGFLSELVLHLRMVLFAPGDYVCRKGEIGKQMFIVNRGTLHVLGDDNKSVLATLRAGSYFGELSILNLGQYGNRRSASVRSLGYSDLFRLSKSDLWDVLKEYPGARRKLEYHAYKKIHDFKMHRRENGKVQDQFSEHPFPGWGDDLRRLGEAMSTDSITISPHNGEHNCNTSDGYGSDPSRLSAPACCWQQQQQPAIPPVNKHPTARDPVAVPKQVSRPGVDKGNPKVQTVTQYRGQSSGNAAEIFGCRTCQCSQVHSGVQSSPFIPSHNLRHGTFGLEFMSASQNTTRSDLPTNRDLSMPANLVSSVVRTFCTHCISSYSCKNSSVDNSYETCPLHRPLAYTEDAENHPVRFGLGDDPDESAHEAKPENLKEDRVRQEISEPGNNVPAIYFEKASSSSSSCSPISHSAECADTVCTPLQSIPYSLHTAWDSTDFLDLPQTRSSAICTPSKRPPWFGLSRLNNSSNNGIKQLENVCVHKIPPSMLSTDEMGPDGNKYEFMREFARLQQRVYLLEQENFVLKSRQHVQTSFDNVERWTTNVSNKCHTIHERDSSSVTTPNVSVKRSTSLQVPSIRRPYRRHSRPVQRKYATIEAPSDEFDIDSSISDFTETERNPRSY
ncbi:cyclic nucleotide gated channel alpha 3, partial [Paragonimus westermani]